jgi:hypothetical protein
MALAAGRLGGRMERRRPRMLAGYGEVTEDNPDRERADPLPLSGAMRAAKVDVDD